MFHIIEHFSKRTAATRDGFAALLAAVPSRLLPCALNPNWRELWEEGNPSRRPFHHFYFPVSVTLLSGGKVFESAVFSQPPFFCFSGDGAKHLTAWQRDAERAAQRRGPRCATINEHTGRGNRWSTLGNLRYFNHVLEHNSVQNLFFFFNCPFLCKGQ